MHYRSLDDLKYALKECTSCPRLVQSRTQVVVSDGEPGAEVMFVGEAPGRKEDETGVPFVGTAGKTLRSHIEEFLVLAGITWIITNLVKCRPVVPPNRNGKPTLEEISACSSQWLFREIELVKPRLIVLLGDYALRGITGKTGISQYRGSPLYVDGIDCPLFPTWHPAALTYDRSKRESFRADFEQIVRIVRPSAERN